ncbi:MAG: serine/threonine protein kinase, partial [Hymenobacteraceae bacterium]|nr:serine/threonine protein kinase [Hymenobacteraceae bacterium]
MPTLQHNDIFAGRYLLDECLASRHLAEVWKVKDLLAEGTLALKVFVPANKLDASTLAQLKADCTKISQLSHPHLLQYRHFDVHEGIPYLLMPYLPHGSLSRRVQENGPLEEQEVAQLLKQVASALHYLHTRQPLLLHHAIRPENILITPKNTYVLTDHGLNYRTRSSLHKAADQAGVTDAAYAPPELFSAHPTRNEAGDIFSLGVTLYEVCTGELPWMGKGGISLLQGAAIPYLPGTYARVLSNILRACLDANPEKRPGA